MVMRNLSLRFLYKKIAISAVIKTATVKTSNNKLPEAVRYSNVFTWFLSILLPLKKQNFRPTN